MSAVQFALTPEERQAAEARLAQQRQGCATVARNLSIFDAWTVDRKTSLEIAAMHDISHTRVGQIARRIHELGKRPA